MLTARPLYVFAFVLAAVGFGAGCASAPESSPEETASNAETEARDAVEVGEVKSPLMRSIGVNGDSCTVRTNPDGTTVPGTEKDGECCSTADTTDCVIILKPFPKSFSYFRY